MPTNNNQQPDFEKSLARLEEINELMSSDEITLDASLELYREAAQLISTVTERLQSAKLEIKKIDELTAE